MYARSFAGVEFTVERVVAQPVSRAASARMQVPSAATVRSDDLSVIQQALPPAFTTEARLLVSTERRRRIELVERVRPHDAGLQLGRHLENPRALVGPHSRGQTVHRVVRLLDRLFERSESQHR